MLPDQPTRKIIFKLVLIGAGICLPLFFFVIEPDNDFAGRFGFMIRDLASGEWSSGFDPWFPPLYFLLSSFLTWLGLPAFSAAQLVIAVFFVGGVIPLYYLFRSIYGARIAWWACCLYLLCPNLVRHVQGGGTLEEMVAAVLIAGVTSIYFFYHTNREWPLALGVGVIAAVLALTKEESLVYALFLLAILLVCEIYKKWNTTRFIHRLPIKTVAAFGLFLVLISPWVAYEYHKTGYPVTSKFQVMGIEKVKNILQAQNGKTDSGKIAIASRRISSPSLRLDAGFPNASFPKGIETGAFPATAISISSIFSDFKETHWDRVDWGFSVNNLWNGFFHIYLVFAIGGALCLVVRGKWRRMDTLLLLGIFAFLAVYFEMRVVKTHNENLMRMQERHISVIMPFILGWTATGASALHDLTRRTLFRRFKVVSKMIVGLFIIVLVWDCYITVRDVFEKEEWRAKQAKLACAEWLITEGRALVPSGYEPLSYDPSKTWRNFRSGNLPIIGVDDPTIPYYAHAEHVEMTRYKRWRHYRSRAKKDKLNFLIWGEGEKELFPGVWNNYEKVPSDFVVVNDKWKDLEEEPMLVLGYKPNLDMEAVRGAAEAQGAQ